MESRAIAQNSQRAMRRKEIGMSGIVAQRFWHGRRSSFVVVGTHGWRRFVFFCQGSITAAAGVIVIAVAALVVVVVHDRDWWFVLGWTLALSRHDDIVFFFQQGSREVGYQHKLETRSSQRNRTRSER